ncbi:MAG: hypothetical protein LLG40_10550 [Deltaproteobacteria bacterium]|nr:hypothetical protein [Deltaproteobacteria bacterium]
MKKAMFLWLLVFVFCGCAGVSITPISKQDALDLHKPNAGKSGYVVYEPMVVVEINKKEVCVKKDDAGKCTDTKPACAAGTPFVLPDYSKPYLIDIKSGIGKAGADITIIDGWRLGSVKDNSDNTAMLGDLVSLVKALRVPDTKDAGKCKEGLYRVTIDNSSEDKPLKLIELLNYN